MRCFAISFLLMWLICCPASAQEILVKPQVSYSDAAQGDTKNEITVGDPVPLHSQGQIVTKENKQSLGVSCSARRKWIEVEGLANKEAERRINADIQRELTVKKRLISADCSAGESYANAATLTGARPHAIGVETSVNFDHEGATGTHIHRCYVFSLKTGQRFDLSRLLTDEGKGFVAQSVCVSAEDDATRRACSGYDAFASALYDGVRYCLKDSGVSVRFGQTNLTHGEITIPEERMSTSFLLPVGLNLSESP